MDRLAPVAAAEGAVIALGVNVDDLADHRPGQRAARERGAVFPLVEAGLTKDLVRQAARQLGLAVWDKPAAACLASRVPYGTPVTLGTLDPGGGGRGGPARPRASASCGCVTTATWPAWSSRPDDLERAVDGPGPGGGGGAGRRLPLRDARPGRAALRQPQRRACARGADRHRVERVWSIEHVRPRRLAYGIEAALPGWVTAASSGSCRAWTGEVPPRSPARPQRGRPSGPARDRRRRAGLARGRHRRAAHHPAGPAAPGGQISRPRCCGRPACRPSTGTGSPSRPSRTTSTTSRRHRWPTWIPA